MTPKASATSRNRHMKAIPRTDSLDLRAQARISARGIPEAVTAQVDSDLGRRVVH